MTKKEFELNFWQHYLWLESEFRTVLEYVELDSANYSTYSRRIEKLILQIGSEFDNVSREICGLQNVDRTSICDYYNYYTSNYNNIIASIVIAGDVRLTPFDGWNNTAPGETLAFWKAYNSIKHDRISNYKEASLKNALDAMAALFCVEMLYAKKLYIHDANEENSFPEIESKLFILDGLEHRIRPSKFDSPQAEANRKIAESLSEPLIEYQKIQKWDGKLPTVSGGNALVSIDPAE